MSDTVVLPGPSEHQWSERFLQPRAEDDEWGQPWDDLWPELLCEPDDGPRRCLRCYMPERDASATPCPGHPVSIVIDCPGIWAP
jgi:hypothetical protein